MIKLITEDKLVVLERHQDGAPRLNCHLELPWKLLEGDHWEMRKNRPVDGAYRPGVRAYLRGTPTKVVPTGRIPTGQNRRQTKQNQGHPGPRAKIQTEKKFSRLRRV